MLRRFEISFIHSGCVVNLLSPVRELKLALWKKIRQVALTNGLTHSSQNFIRIHSEPLKIPEVLHNFLIYKRID